MRQLHAARSDRVLVIGAQGVLGGLIARAFTRAGWNVLAGARRPDSDPAFRHVDLEEPGSLATTLGDADLVVNTVPDPDLTAERLVLSLGGVLINVSAMPAAAGRQLRNETIGPRGLVMMNAGIAPG